MDIKTFGKWLDAWIMPKGIGFTTNNKQKSSWIRKKKNDEKIDMLHYLLIILYKIFQKSIYEIIKLLI